MQHGVQPDFVTTQMLASVRMAEWELTHNLELLAEVHCKTSLPQNMHMVTARSKHGCACMIRDY
jgi:hypothetical protein